MAMITAKQFRERAAARRNDHASTAAGLMRCFKCKVPLQETVTGSRHVGKDYSCSDCYFDSISNVIEANPIIPSRVRRRA